MLRHHARCMLLTDAENTLVGLITHRYCAASVTTGVWPLATRPQRLAVSRRALTRPSIPSPRLLTPCTLQQSEGPRRGDAARDTGRRVPFPIHPDIRRILPPRRVETTRLSALPQTAWHVATQSAMSSPHALARSRTPSARGSRARSRCRIACCLPSCPSSRLDGREVGRFYSGPDASAPGSDLGGPVSA
jgi:hypothetical protein